MHNETITSVKLVPEFAWLITTSKDKTVKFWKLNQLHEAVEPKKDVREIVKQEQPKYKKPNQNMVENDPFWEEEQQAKRFIEKEVISKKQEKNTFSESKPPKIEKVVKKEDSDEDLTGWDT